MRKTSWAFLEFSILVFLLGVPGAEAAGVPPPKISALIGYIKASAAIACPMQKGDPAFTALSAKTMELKDRLNELASELSDVPGGANSDALKQITAWLGALKDADSTTGKEDTICAAADNLNKLAPPASPDGAKPTPSSDIQIDQKLIVFPLTEANVAASDMQFSLSNAGKDTQTISLSGPIQIVERRSRCDTASPPKCETVEKASKDFKITQTTGTCSSAMSGGQSCQIHVGFTPVSAGEKTATAKFKVAVGSADPPVEFSKEVALSGEGFVKDIAPPNGDGTGSNTPNFRITAGIDATGSTHSQVQQKYYLDAIFDAPLGVGPGHGDPLNAWLLVFFNPRITSLPRPPTALSNLTVQGFSDILNSSTSTTDFVQGVDVQAGIEFCPYDYVLCVRPRHGIPFFSSYKNMHARIGVYLVAGGGFTTPFASQVNNPTVFSLADGAGNFPSNAAYVPFFFPNPNFDPNRPDTFIADPTKDQGTNPSKLFSNAAQFAGKQAFAFILEDRSRFYRKFFVGWRLKTYHFSDLVRGNCDSGSETKYTAKGSRCEGVQNAYPGVVDFTVGKDEQVTAGHLSSWIFRLDANYPLPFAPYAHVLLSLDSAFLKNHTTLPFIPPATSTLPLGSPLVGIVTVSRFPDHDLYRIGIGFDLLEIKNAISKKVSTQKQEAPSDAAAAQTPAKPNN